MEEITRRLSGLYDAADCPACWRRSGHQSGCLPRDRIRTAHGQGNLASQVRRRVLECTAPGIWKWAGFYLHRVSATLAARSSAGWTRGCYKDTHLVDAQSGCVTDAISAPGWKRVIFCQR